VQTQEGESSEMCKEQKIVLDEIIEDANSQSKSIQKEISSILALMEDAKTYVPEKEQEAEQAKRWSETALMEIDLEKTRFSEKDANYAKNIEACEQALSLLGTTGNLNMIQGAKLSNKLQNLADSNLNPEIQALILLSSQQSSENISQIIDLLKNLQKDLQVSREVNKKNHEGALEGAQAYAEEKYYTYYNLNRQLNIIIDNQAKLQQELYHKQLELENQSDRIRNTQAKSDMLRKLCLLEEGKNKRKALRGEEHAKVVAEFLEKIEGDD
jgi:uncharacterized protein (UPF0147 family)